MNLLKTIIFIGLAMCILSSQSEGDDLVIPEGGAKGVAIDAQKLENHIANQFNSISEVTHISFSDDFYAIEAIFGIIDRFTVSFNVRTVSGTLYENIQCEATSNKTDLFMANCESDQVVLTPFSADTDNQIPSKLSRTQVAIKVRLGSIALETSKKYID